MLKGENQENRKGVIEMGFTNSSLSVMEHLSPNRNSPRTENKITKITIHHTAGITSLETFDSIVSKPTREMSANYCVDCDGRIGLFCPESDRSWCSSSAWNDNRAVTIEVSNDIVSEPWSIGKKTYDSLIKLCVDICKRNGIERLYYDGKDGTLTRHCDFTPTQCPGTWIKDHTQQICDEVNAQLGSSEKSANTPKIIYTKKINSKRDIYDEPGGNVIATAEKGTYSITADRQVGDIVYGKLLSGAGWIQTGKKNVKKDTASTEVSTKPAVKTESDYDKAADDVIAGKYGNGDERKKKLEAEGYEYAKVQAVVNKKLAPSTATFSKRVAPAASFDSKYSGTYVVTADSLNMRYRPAFYVTENVVKILRKGQTVQCYGYYTAVDGVRWYYITYGLLKGYVCGSYVRKR